MTIAKPAIGPILYLLLFLSVANTLFSFPVDKVAMLILCLFFYFQRPQMSLPLVGLLVLALIEICILLLNAFTSTVSVIVLFPILGAVFVLQGAASLKDQEVENVLVAHILLAGYFLVIGYLSRNDDHVHFLYDKGLSFLAAPMGLTSTVQTFGTLCVAWVVLHLRREGLSASRSTRAWLFALVIGFCLMTFSRATYINLLVVIVVFRPKVLIWLVFFGLLGFLIFPEISSSVIGATGTIMSRLEYLKGYLVAVSHGSLFQVLFGHSNSIITDPTALEVNESQPLIENGLMSFVFTFGVLGYLALFLVSATLLLRWRGTKWKEAFLLGYFLTVAQISTSEYFSTSLYFLLLSIVVKKKELSRFDVG